MRRLLLVLLVLVDGSSAWGGENPTLVVDARGHTGRVWKVVFTPDNQQLISVSFDKSIRVWDLATGESVRTLRPPAGPGEGGTLIAAAVSPDGQTLAAAGVGPAASSQDHPVYLISLASWQITRLLRGSMGPINHVVYSRDGKHVAAASHDKTARVWEAATGREVQVLRGHTELVEAIALSPDGRRAATTSLDGTVRLWTVPAGATEATLKAHDKGGAFVAWSPDGKVVASGGHDGVIKFWDPAGKLLRQLTDVGCGDISSLTFTPNSERLLFTGWSFDQPRARVEALIDVKTGKYEQESRTDLSLTDGTVSPNGKLLAVATVQAEIFVLDAATGRVLHKLAPRGYRSLYNAAWSRDGRGVAWGVAYSPELAKRSQAPLVRGFDFAKLELIDPVRGDFARAELVRKDRSLVLNPKTGNVELRTPTDLVRTFRPRRTVGLPENVSCYSWITDQLIAVGADGPIYLFDAETGALRRKLVGHSDWVSVVAPSADGRYLVSSSNDRTLRIWRADREEPLLSLFTAGNDWVAWTPEGYYAASPGGERLMGWQVNNGPDRLASFHPAAAFRKTLYRPDVVRRLVEAGSLEKALAAADQERGRSTAATTVAEVLPPVVLITSPDQAKVEVQEPTVTVRFVARPVGKHPITAARLLVDGRPYIEADGAKVFNPPRAGEIREAWTAKIASGKHSVAVQVETAASKGVSEPVEVYFGARGMTREGGDVARPPEMQKPALYILAVGVSDYPGDLKLNFAAKDAETLARACEAGGKALYRKVEVKLLTDKEATRKNILQGLTWLRKQMTQNDVAIISFAGHGDKDADGSFYLLPVDVDKDDLLSSAVPGEQIKRTLAGIPGKFLLLLDACHAGAVGSDRRRAAGSLTDDLVRDLATDDYGVVVLCSSMGREFSLESPKVGHGYFTLALVEGLSGKADYNKDQLIHLNELDLYVTDRVKELSGGRQHPVTVRPSSIRSFPLSKP
jgi:WD40 repeat protein